MSFRRSATTELTDVGSSRETSQTVVKKRGKEQHTCLVLCHRSRTKLLIVSCCFSWKYWETLVRSDEVYERRRFWWRRPREADQSCGERAPASAMGVPAYQVLQSITRNKGKKRKRKPEGRGNEKIGSCVKAAKRNQSSETGLLLAIIFLFDYGRY